MFLHLTLFISFIIFILGILYAWSNKSNTIKVENKWTVSTYHENDLPVIMKHIQKVPEKNIIKRLPYLIVVSWKYDGSNNNGMPEKEVNGKMITLEEVISDVMQKTNIFTHVYTKTGNNLKEFVYYCTSQNEFMKVLNETLKNHEAYPIEINFYEDKEWIDLKNILSRFSK